MLALLLTALHTGLPVRVAQGALASMHGAGSIWVGADQLGVQHCAMQGTLQYRRTNARGVALSRTTQERYMLLNLWCKVARNDSHASVRCAGQFTDLPCGVRYRFLKSPSGFVQQLQAGFALRNVASGLATSMQLVKTDKVPPFHTQVEAMRAFHLQAEVSLGESYTIKLEDQGWPQGCQVSAILVCTLNFSICAAPESI